MTRSAKRRSRAAQVCICCAVVVAGDVADGANDTWKTPTNGVWGANASWTDNSVPTNADQATFNLGGIYAVTFQATPAAVQDLFFQNSSTNVRLQSNQFGPWTLNVNSASGGMDAVVSGGAALTIGGTSSVQVSALNVNIGDDLRVEQSSVMDLTAVSSVFCSDLFVNSAGTVRVLDGSTLQAFNTGTVGSASSGSLVVFSGGDALIGNARLAEAGGTANVSLNGDGSLLLGSGTTFDVGHSGTSQVFVENGAELRTMQGSGATSNIGTEIGATGTVHVDGVNSTWMNAGLHVGHSGTGTLNITNAGFVNSFSASSASVIGANAGSNGTVNVAAGSGWAVGTRLEVGGAGTGTLNVTGGGGVLVFGDFSVRQGGTATISGTGSGMDVDNALTVSGAGAGSSATLRIEAGGAISSNSGSIANFGSGVATVTGTGSFWTVAGDLAMSQGGVSNGTLDVLDDGIVTIGGNLTSGTGTSTLTLDGGRLDMTGGEIGGGGGATTFDVLNFRSGTLMNVAQINNGATPLTKTTAGTLTLIGTNTFTGGTVVQAGTLRANRLHENNPVTITAGTLQILESSPTLPNHPSGNNASVSVPSSLSIAPGATLDLTNNDLVLDYSGASPIAAYETLVASGYNVTGDWQGDGITSSLAATDGNYVVAIADNAALTSPFGTSQGGPLFAGVDVDLTTVLIKFTHRADINLDGLVTPDDSAIFGGAYEENQSAVWSTGDMNYDGVFTPDDAAIFGGAYDESLTSLPEPASMGLLALSTLGLARRRLRQSLV